MDNEEAATELKALQLFKIQPADFDLVVADYVLTVMTGVDVINEIKKKVQPNIFLFSVLRVLVRRKMAILDVGIDRVIYKPFKVKELEARIQATIHARNLLKENEFLQHR